MSDARFMRACLRYARRHAGLTGTNPSVGTLIVRDDVIVGRGVTARGGRPHAEPVALAEAGALARGATAYVTLEPCAHHGVTPPCAEALIAANIGRVVTAYLDPDRRVDGRGHAMLRAAGITVDEGLESVIAARDLAGYLMRKVHARPHITLKLAVSADGLLGREGEEVAVTGPLARAQVHAMRAKADAILVGRGTARADDPDLSCRLPGLAARSPHRYVLDTRATLAPDSRLVRTARDVPTTIVSAEPLPDALREAGVGHLSADLHEGGVALPEMLEDMGAVGHATLMVEGGARVARAFLASDLVDRAVLFVSPRAIGSPGAVGSPGIASPLLPDAVPHGFALADERRFGEDRALTFERST